MCVFFILQFSCLSSYWVARRKKENKNKYQLLKSQIFSSKYLFFLSSSYLLSMYIDARKKNLEYEKKDFLDKIRL